MTGEYYVNGKAPQCFKDFLEHRPKDRPFHFWFGSSDPHRGYKNQSGAKENKRKLEDIDRIPSFWPDTNVVRHDMLDYAYEIERFDREVGEMVALLEAFDLLDNTLIVMTSDHGMPFPRIKGDSYEMACKIPMAMMWPNGIKQPGRTSDALVSFIDIAPTFLELAGIDGANKGMEPIQGRSMTEIFDGKDIDAIIPERKQLLLGVRTQRSQHLPHPRNSRRAFPLPSQSEARSLARCGRAQSQTQVIQQSDHQRSRSQDGPGLPVLETLFQQTPGRRAL